MTTNEHREDKMTNEAALRAEIGSLHRAVQALARERDTAVSGRDRAEEEVEALRSFIEGWTGRLPPPPVPPGTETFSYRDFGSAGALILEGHIKKAACEEFDKSLVRLPRRP